MQRTRVGQNAWGAYRCRQQRQAPYTLCFLGPTRPRRFPLPRVRTVFDYLQPDGYFKTHEKNISGQNREIAEFERGQVAEAKAAYAQQKALLDAAISEYKERILLSKQQRDARRANSALTEEETAAMTRQSQFEKAELSRMKKKAKALLEPFDAKLKTAESQLEAMKHRRRTDSEALQAWLFENFRLLNARGETRSVGDIFAATPMRIAPSGAGECCAPKLLQEAYSRGLTPLSIAEYWYGQPKEGEVRRHGEHYPACRGKCLPVLTWMLQGLVIEPPLKSDSLCRTESEPEIIYENEWFCVLNKPSGMLSVPGKAAAISVQQWIEQKYGTERKIKMAHRLDQDTSGLLIATFGDTAYKIMQTLFATRMVEKTYIAMLDGDYTSGSLAAEGRISLPLAPDWLDRPRQRVDHTDGKEAVTDYRFISTENGRSLIAFHPITGRTHQLRVHAASDQGLNMPIAGDRLYGLRGGNSAERLHLHAHKITFTFPINGESYTFTSPVPF